MTLLVRRRATLLWIALCVVVSLVPAILAYHALTTVPLDEAAVKLAAERFLFVGIVAALFILLAGAAFLARTFALTSALTLVSNLNRISGHDADAALHRLGDVGDSIRRLYGRLNELSARKTTRIASLDALADALLSSSTRRLVVVDPFGKVLRATAAAIEHLESSPSATIGRPVEQALPGIDFERIAASAARSVNAQSIHAGKHHVMVAPVVTGESGAVYYLFYLGRDARELSTDSGSARADAPDTATDGSQTHAAAQTTPSPGQSTQSRLLSRLRTLFGGDRTKSSGGGI